MYNWKNIFLSPSDTLKKAIQVLDDEALRIVLVVNDKKQLLGTVTDGDVRRALIRGSNMDTLLSDMMYAKPTVAPSGSSREELLKIMKNKDLLQIPLVEGDMTVVGLETISNLLDCSKLENTVFLMAGGIGKRLHPLTKDVPKPLLRVGQKPILETILEQFISFGFHNFYISTHYKAEMIKSYFGNGDQWKVNINYIHEDEPLGTAGALGLLPAISNNLPVIVMNGDVLTKVNFENLLSFHREQGGVATMCVREYDFQVPYGVVESNGSEVTSIIEKPVHRFFVNAGIYVLEQSFVRSVSENHAVDMTTLLNNEIKKSNKVNLFPVFEYWLDIGQKNEFFKAQDDLKEYFKND